MSDKGFTLIELLVTMALLAIVIAAVVVSYSTVLKLQVQQGNIAKTNIEEGISLEILRKDIEMAGFGLPWDMNGQTYNEASNSMSYVPNPATFNDAPLSPPRAFVISNNGNTSANNSDVLVIKSSVALLSNITQRWGYVTNDGVHITYTPLSPQSSSIGYFVVLNKDRKLEKIDYQPSSSTPPTFIDSLNEGDIYFAFGISDISPRMPFNRVDYYLQKPATGFPERCCPTTYELYRANINQSNGNRNPQPILDCVKDFQVSFGLDNNGDGSIDTWSSTLPSTASDIRNKVKQVRVFILYQEGSKERGYSYSGTITLGDADTGVLKTFTPSGSEVNYRWKVVRLVVFPLNLKPQQR